jgi:hypothetical protein
MLTAASRRKFDVVMAWASIAWAFARRSIPRSASDRHHDVGGQAHVSNHGRFCRFERSMIRTRVIAGLKRAKDQIKRHGHFVTKRGEVRKRLGRPGAEPDKLRKSRTEITKGIGIVKVAKAVGLGVGTVARLKKQMMEARDAA